MAKSGTLAAVLLLGLAASLGPWRGTAASVEQQVAFGAPFTLVDADGKTVTSSDFRGKWLLIYFGYTHCADQCPTMLGTIAETLDRLGPAAAQVQPFFITIDPERDSGPVLRDYTDAFDKRLIGLRGTPEQIDAVARAFGVAYRKVALDEADYVIDHSSTLFLVDRMGRYAVSFGHMSDPYMISSKLFELLALH